MRQSNETQLLAQIRDLRSSVKALQRQGAPGARDLGFMGAIPMLQMFPGLVGLWPGSVLGSGTTGNLYYTDLSGHGLHLTRNAGTFIIGGTGGPYSYYWFNGSTGYANHADANIFDILGTESGIWSSIRGLTIGGWFRFDNNAGANGEMLMGKSHPTSDGLTAYTLRRVSSSFGGNIIFRIGDNTGFFTAQSAEVTGGSWRFIVGKYSPSTALSILIDAVKVTNTTSIPASLISTTHQFSIGARSEAPDSYFDGNASLCFLCAAAVPDEMINAFYQYSKGLFT